jgi:hypothetical protein
LLTTKVLFYVDSKVPRSIPAGIAFYGSMDLYVGVGPDGQRSDAFYFNKSDGKHEEEKVATFAVAGSNPNMLEGPSLTGSISTTKNFVRIGHSLFAPLAGWLGGQLSQRLCRCSRSQEPSTAVDVEGITDIDDLTTTVRDMDDKRR